MSEVDGVENSDVMRLETRYVPVRAQYALEVNIGFFYCELQNKGVETMVMPCWIAAEQEVKIFGEDIGRSLEGGRNGRNTLGSCAGRNQMSMFDARVLIRFNLKR